MISIDTSLTPGDLAGGLEELFRVGAKSVSLLRTHWKPENGTPVFTVAGSYTTRGWTEWTQGFQYGCPLLLFEATGNREFLDYGRTETMSRMAPHLTHTGVHDHGFNNVSTYGNLLRFMAEGLTENNSHEAEVYRLALAVSGAVQAARWTRLPDGLGYVPSFNGAHSLFSDTIRSMRSLAVSHQLGHVLMGEQDERISLLARLLAHAEATARYNVYYGTGRDSYDIRGRVVHESIFNVESGAYRCPSTQQGYSPFTTWTRGLSWILAGYPEQLEWLEGMSEQEFQASGSSVYSSLADARERFLEVSRAVADFYLEQTPTDGVPYWDTGAPGLVHMGDYRDRPSEPFNAYEPVDSSAAAISAQGLLRLGRYLMRHGEQETGARYQAAAFTVARTLFSHTYLAQDAGHQGILLHSVYHRPNGWDHVAAGEKVPSGESSMWGDYHALELGVAIRRLGEGKEPQRFFDIGVGSGATE
jgi:unsaturated chondroitin disaccharide hydrolase